MPFHYKAFVLVMVITAVMFPLAKPLFLNFMSEEDFVRRRNLWIGITVAAFLIPNFWIYSLVVAVLVGYGVRKDSNPAALYLFLMLTVPPVQMEIPSFVINQVFTMNHLRLLSLVLLLPVALQLRGPTDRYAGGVWPDGTRRRSLEMADFLVLGYVVIQFVLMFPYESGTASLRRIFLLFLDIVLPYFVVSRVCRTREMIVDAMAALALAAVILTPLAVVETVRGWILYAGLQERWGAPMIMGYITRGELLRAQVTAGHAIVLGYAMAMAFGFWLYLQHRVESKGWRWLTVLTLMAGLLAPLARGPWMGAAAVLFIFLALGPQAMGRIVKATGLLAVVGGIALASPLGGTIVDHLPFIGTVNEETVTYRQRLAELSWLLIQQHPYFGSPFYMNYMEELRQGQGIIDIVNAYAGIALNFGLVGLALFVGFFFTIVIRCVRVVRWTIHTDPDFASMGAGIVACTVGALLIIATTSNYLSTPYIYWALAGLGVAYVRLAGCGVASADASFAEPHALSRQGGLAP